MFDGVTVSKSSYAVAERWIPAVRDTSNDTVFVCLLYVPSDEYKYRVV